MKKKRLERGRVSKARRKLLQQLTGTAMGAAIIPTRPILADKVKSPPSRYSKSIEPKRANGFLTPQQFTLVEELTETVIPTDSHSDGAKAARVVDYIDRVLRETSNEEEKEIWHEGLRLVDVMSQRECGKSFVESSPEERIAVLQILSDNAQMSELPEIKFFNALKRLTVDGYYTSKIGILEELQYKGNTVLEEFVGCEDAHRKPS